MTNLSDDYNTLFTQLSDQAEYSLAREKKTPLLMQLMSALHARHLQSCPAYTQIFKEAPIHFDALTDIPYLAVRLFKMLELSSIDTASTYRVAHSSGTTGQARSKIFLDKITSQRQTQTLVRIFQHHLGKQRLPMLIIDEPGVTTDSTLTARAAGIQAMMIFGRKPTYALNKDLSLNHEAINNFAKAHTNTPVLIFGFTHMVYQNFVRPLESSHLNVNLKNGILVHGGGWKKLQEQAISNADFKKKIARILGITRIHNFYGMAEQLGSVFVECNAGVLHAPNEADVLIRCPKTLKPLPAQEEGLVQVLSALPTSYPGFSILTEDKGTWLGEDDCPCGLKGRYFQVTGRLPKAEVRGCSDTQGEAA